jgi:hypothetical protein
MGHQRLKFVLPSGRKTVYSCRHFVMTWTFQQERRIWPRRQARLEVMYGTTPPLTLTSSVDISNRGVAFESPKAYGLGTSLAIQVLVDSARRDEGWFYAQAKVARIENGVVAVEFMKVSAEDARKLDALFRRLGPAPVTK